MIGLVLAAGLLLGFAIGYRKGQQDASETNKEQVPIPVEE